MGARVAAADHDLVVFNRTRSRAEEAAGRTGARVAETAREAAEAAEVVLVSLADDAARVDDVRGDDGLIGGVAARCRGVRHQHRCAGDDPRSGPAVAERGASLLDTPVSGSVPVVEAGQLTVMAGGDPEALVGRSPCST